MPKITASTVAEHRAQQHRQVLDAALRSIVAHDGVVPTLGAIAAEVGLGRSTLYHYVSSRTDMVVQLLLDSMEEWQVRVTAAMDSAAAAHRGSTAPGEGMGMATAQMRAYVRTTLELFADGTRYALMRAAAQEPAVFDDPRIAEAHHALRPRIIELLIGAGLSDVEAEALSQLVDAATHRGAELMAQGTPEEAVMSALDRMVQLPTDADSA